MNPGLSWVSNDRYNSVEKLQPCSHFEIEEVIYINQDLFTK